MQKILCLAKHKIDDGSVQMSNTNKNDTRATSGPLVNSQILELSAISRYEENNWSVTSGCL